MITLAAFLEKIKDELPISFHETILVITENYDYTPTEFRNGLGGDLLINAPGTNEGSCKIFAFAKLHGLDVQKTLNLFGDYYRIDVLENPEAENHRNIRNFMKYGWEGIKLEGAALKLRSV